MYVYMYVYYIVFAMRNESTMVNSIKIQILYYCLSTCPPKNHANTDSSHVSDLKKNYMASIILMS